MGKSADRLQHGWDAIWEAKRDGYRYICNIHIIDRPVENDRMGREYSYALIVSVCVRNE